MHIDTIIAILLSPVFAVLITLWYQRRKEKRDAKLRIFTTLMAYRKSNPPTVDWVNSLNLIDVVFEDEPTVVTLWHQYYTLLCTKPPNYEEWNHKYLDLLSQIAKILGYKNLKQTDIDTFYNPQALEDQIKAGQKLAGELLRVLENTASLVVAKRENEVKEQSQ